MKLYKGLLAIGVALLSWTGQAQTVIPDSIPDHTPQHFDECLDSLLNLWYVNTSATDLVLDTLPVNDQSPIGKLPDSVYIERIANINSPIPYVFNDKVRAYIELYTLKRRDQVKTMLGLSEYYFPMFEEQLDAHNIPLELKYLPIIESALNPRAFSRAGASGLWQFMYYTGKQYGLNINSYIDERRDPYQSTVAAVSYLNDLYAIYKDWFLVIAAYNCGPGNVNKAIRRSGGQRDFWKIYYHLPRETRGYVPAFIAATYTFIYARQHKLYPTANTLPAVTDTILINKPLHFKQIASMLDVDVNYLRDLNPQYRRDVIPSQRKAYPLRLAFDHVTDFAALEDTIYQYQRNKYFTDGKLVAKPEYSVYTPDKPKGKATVYYTVKSGDAVGLIADWFDVRTSDLRYWNNIRRNIIRVGQKLVVYVPKSKVDYYKQVNTLSYAEKQRRNGNTVTASTVRKAPVKEDPNYIYYTVRSGDNLWSIAKKYRGVSNSDIMRLNDLSDASRLSPGQKLKIKPKS